MTAWFRKADSKIVVNETLVDSRVAAEKLTAFIVAKSKLVKASELNDDTKLFSSGLLDSLAFVELVLFVEKEFHLKLAAVTDVNMDSLDSIEDIIGHIVTSAGGT